MARFAPALKILSYHSVTPSRRGTKWQVPVARFWAQMQYLVARGIPVLPLLEAVQRLRNGTHPRRAVVLTFDDGYLDNYTQVLPVLRCLRLPAMLFVLADQSWQDRALPPEEQQPRMDWGQLREWRAAGLDVGVHGMDHAELSALSDVQLESHLVGARRIIAEHLGEEPSPAFSYPYAISSLRVREAAREAGYVCAVGASNPRACRPDSELFALQRETVYGDTPLWAFAAKVHPAWDLPRLAWFAPARRTAHFARRLLASSQDGGRAVQTCEPKP